MAVTVRYAFGTLEGLGAVAWLRMAAPLNRNVIEALKGVLNARAIARRTQRPLVGNWRPEVGLWYVNAEDWDAVMAAMSNFCAFERVARWQLNAERGPERPPAEAGRPAPEADARLPRREASDEVRPRPDRGGGRLISFDDC
jgi:hypothetical protein